MIQDLNKGIVGIDYNHLNFPTAVYVNGQGDVTFTYAADGTKLRKVVSENGNTTTTDYASNYIYVNNTLKQFAHPEGYVSKNGNNFDYVYHYKDHLGSVRLAYSDLDGNGSIQASTEILQERNTYPFGLEHKGYNSNVIEENNFQTYLGQELNKELGLGWLTFRYRNYMPELGRFFGVDPVSSEYMTISTYQFAHNNPIWKVEIEGLEGEETAGKDKQNHEPIKVTNRNNGSVAGAAPLLATQGKMEVVYKATEKLAVESVKKPGLATRILGATGRVLGNAVIYLMPFSLDEPQPTDFMPDLIDFPAPSNEPAPSDENEDEDDSDVVYRGGSFTDNNFTPRPGKDDGTGPKSGLSTFKDPIQATMGKGGKVQVLSVKALKAIGLEVTETSDGHVGIRPANQKTLKEWAASRNIEGGMKHALTALVKTTRITELKLPKQE